MKTQICTLMAAPMCTQPCALQIQLVYNCKYRSWDSHTDTQTYKPTYAHLCADTQTHVTLWPAAPRSLWVSELGSLLLPPATSVHGERDSGCGNLVSVFTEAQLSVYRLVGNAVQAAPSWPSEPWTASLGEYWFKQRCGAPPAVGLCWEGASCPPVCTCLGHWAWGSLFEPLLPSE